MLAASLSILSQTETKLLPSCNNEDFESSSGGLISNSLAVSGWTINKLGSTLSICNSTALAAPNATYSNPMQNYVELFDVPTGTVDPLIGPSYTIFSVFGSGSPNLGSNTTPSITNMYGDKFIRVHRKDSNSLVNHSIEKTISVTAANSLFRFAILPLVESSSGGCCAQPGVYIRFFNVTASGSTLLSCPAYSITQETSQCPNPLSQSMNTVATGSFTTGKYHKWRIHSVDLSPYIGMDIKFKLANMNCATGCLHFGYTYLDAQCSPMQIYVNDTPFPAHTNSVTFVGCGVQTATVVAPPDFNTYSWIGPAGFTSTLSTITATATGIYTLTIGTSGTCSTIVKYVNLSLYPTPSLTAVSNKTMICAGNSATITSSGLTTYSLNGNPTSSIVVVKPSSSITYTVSGKNMNGCSSTSTVAISVSPCTGILSEEGAQSNMFIFPNPSDGRFSIAHEKGIEVKEVKILNSLGQVLFKQQDPKSESFKLELAAGVYHYTILDSKGVLSKGKLLIE